MKRILAFLLCLCLLLSACSGAPDPTDPTPENTTAPPDATEAVPDTTEAVPDTTEAAPDTTEAVPDTTEAVPDTTEAELKYRHPITGEWLAAPMTNRPIAISTNNYGAAQPVLGIAHADVVIEHTTEGGGYDTRMLAIYTDLDFKGQLGSIRSARTYSLDMAAMFDAPLIHCGGSAYAESQIKRTGHETIDQIYNSSYFYRDKDRLSAGYSSEHTLVTEPAKVLAALKAHKVDLTAPEDAYYGFDFADEVDLNGESAKEITMQYYNTSGKKTIFSYDATDGMYYGRQKWTSKQRDIADGNDGKPVPFKNILILQVKLTYADNNVNTYLKLTGEGEGYFACNGEIVKIKWSRASRNDPFTLTLADGTPITFGVGKTFISLLATRSPEISYK